MPTEAVTGTKHMKTTAPKTSKSTKSDEPSSDEPAGEGTQEGHYRRRNWTDESGKVHVEENRPGSKAWVEVDAD